MAFRFPIKDIEVQSTSEKKTIVKPGYSYDCVNLNQHEFSLDLEGIAWFYARNGNYIEVMAYKGVHHSTLELYLNGSVYGAILHQRKTLPLHGSCFRYQQNGVMICGESGVGKSSLTAAFCLKGADFLTDDVTPIVFKEDIPHIWAMSDRIKLYNDSLKQLNQNKEDLTQVGPEWEKFYLPMDSDQGNIVPLNYIIVLHIHGEQEIRVQPLKGIEKFTALRNEIYRWEYLKGMAESEVAYIAQLLTLAQAVRVTKVFRPANILIDHLQLIIEKHFVEEELIQEPVA